MRKLADDCFVHDKDRLRHEDALTLLRERMTPIAGITEIELAKTTGKILAEDVIAPRNIPAFDNSAVDGYAYAHADYQAAGGFFPLTARIVAGETSNIEMPTGSAARIFTGAKMPEGADTIAMQEDCEAHIQDGSNFVAIPDGLKQGANCRLAGEDVRERAIIAKAGSYLRPQDLAAIASTGTEKIKTFAALRIALLSSGDEVLRPGEAFEDGKVYDANHFMLRGMLEQLGCEVTDLGVSKDDATGIQATLSNAAQNHDVIISTGGASKGEEDHFIDALDTLGKRHLWQLAVKPGRPMCFGQIQDTVCFTLPGNPVAAFLCFLMYVRPSLLRLSGAEWKTPQRYSLPADFSIKSKPDRREFLRGYLVQNNDGNTQVHKFNRDGSGLITGLRESTGFIEIAEETTSVNKGEIVNFIPFSEFGII